MAKDSLGVDIKVGDVVIVNSWGRPVRLLDTGRRGVVEAITPKGLLRLSDSDPDPHPNSRIAKGASVHPSYVGVVRRDGQPGYEGNARKEASR